VPALPELYQMLLESRATTAQVREQLSVVPQLLAQVAQLQQQVDELRQEALKRQRMA